MSRVPYPDMDQLSPLKHDRIFAPGRRYVLNVQKMNLHIPDALWAAQADLGAAAMQAAGFDARTKELVVLRVAVLDKSEYELFHHRGLGLDAGIRQAELDAVEAGDLGAFPPRERALLEFVDEVVRDVSPSDETLARIRKHFSLPEVFAVVTIIGSYMLTSRLAAVGGVEFDEKPVNQW